MQENLEFISHTRSLFHRGLFSFLVARVWKLRRSRKNLVFPKRVTHSNHCSRGAVDAWAMGLYTPPHLVLVLATLGVIFLKSLNYIGSVVRDVAVTPLKREILLVHLGLISCNGGQECGYDLLFDQIPDGLDASLQSWRVLPSFAVRANPKHGHDGSFEAIDFVRELDVQGRRLRRHDD